MSTSRSSSPPTVRAGSPRAATTLGCSSPTCPTSVPSASVTRAQRPGWKGATASADTSSARPSDSPIVRASSTASATSAGRPSPSQPARTRSPASNRPACRGCGGTASRMAASTSGDGWMPTSSVGAARCGPRSSATTRPSSNSPTSRAPRATLRRNASTIVASRRVRISGCSSDSGLASRTVCATSASTSSPSAAKRSAPTNGALHTSNSPWPASTSATSRRTRWAWVSPAPPGGVGTTEGMRS